MAVINRFSNTLRGAVIITGNTLGLASGNLTDISSFTTGLVDPPSGGTTNVFSSNSSQARLDIPLGATVVYAELNWGGTAANNSGATAPVNNNITLVTPLGVTNTIVRDPATTQIIGIIGPLNFAWYCQSVNVTDIVKAGGSGFYRINSVPMILADGGVGWCLCVVYTLITEPFRNINMWALNNQNPLTISIMNFSTPETGEVSGNLCIAANNGQPGADGETMSFGASETSLITLSGPNNPANNFFVSQINGNDGLLNTTGTWGNANAATSGLPVAGSRYNYDITRVNVSAGLTNNQQTAVIQLSNTGDLVNLNLIALQIDVNSADIAPIVKIRDKVFADIGDIITYTITFKNNGLVSADNSIFVDTIPNGTTFINNSLIINGIANLGNPNPPGVGLGTIAPDEAVTITFKVLVTTIPSPNPLVNQSGLGYNFVSAPGLTPVKAFDSSNSVSTEVNHVSISSSKQVNKTFGNIGDILTYTIPISTFGNVSANNVVFIDTIPNGTSLITGSLLINGQISSENPNPPGISLGNLKSGTVTTIVFKLIVNTIPSPNPILNSATINYSYTVDPITPFVKSQSSNTNIVSTQINNANLGNITKLTDRSFVDCGEVITYTIIIPNSGSVTAQNIIFKDTIPSGTSFITNSVVLNETTQFGANPSLGVTIPNIAPGAATTLTFQVRVIC